MQLDERQLEDLSVLVKSDAWNLLLALLEGTVENHVDDVDTVEDLYLAKGKNYMLNYLQSMEVLLEQANDL